MTICISFVIYIFGYAAFPILAYSESTLPGYCNVNSSIVNWSPILNTTLTHRDDHYDNGYVRRSLGSEACSWVIIVTVIFVGIAVGFLRANLGILFLVILCVKIQNILPYILEFWSPSQISNILL